jgi:hypothetical protein
MIDRVQAYVQDVVKGELEGDASIGRFLLDTLNTTTEGLEKGKLESLFNIHVQVCLIQYPNKRLMSLLRTRSWFYISQTWSDLRPRCLVD